MAGERVGGSTLHSHLGGADAVGPDLLPLLQQQVAPTALFRCEEGGTHEHALASAPEKETLGDKHLLAR